MSCYVCNFYGWVKAFQQNRLIRVRNFPCLDHKITFRAIFSPIVLDILPEFVLIVKDFQNFNLGKLLRIFRFNNLLLFCPGLFLFSFGLEMYALKKELSFEGKKIFDKSGLGDGLKFLRFGNMFDEP